jgi:hypothetical protein
MIWRAIGSMRESGTVESGNGVRPLPLAARQRVVDGRADVLKSPVRVSAVGSVMRRSPRRRRVPSKLAKKNSLLRRMARPAFRRTG